MNNDKILQKLTATFPEVNFSVSGEGCRFTIQAVGDTFVQVSRLKRQQMLNEALAEFLKEEIHAVQYKIFTLAEFATQEK
jgi:acid stress-induced BolA-like protein IbaG/YrbA